MEDELHVLAVCDGFPETEAERSQLYKDVSAVNTTEAATTMATISRIRETLHSAGDSIRDIYSALITTLEPSITKLVTKFARRVMEWAYTLPARFSAQTAQAANTPPNPDPAAADHAGKDRANPKNPEQQIEEEEEAAEIYDGRSLNEAEP